MYYIQGIFFLGKGKRLECSTNHVYFSDPLPLCLLLDNWNVFSTQAWTAISDISSSLKDHWYRPTPLPTPLVFRNKGKHHGFFVFQHYSKNVGLVVSTTRQNEQLLSLKLKYFVPIIVTKIEIIKFLFSLSVSRLLSYDKFAPPGYADK